MSTPAQGYYSVTDAQLDTLLHERVHELEIAHARTVLLCREVANTPAEAESGHFEQLADIERRIAVHMSPPKAEEEAGAHAAEPPVAPVKAGPDDLDLFGESHGAARTNETVTVD